MVSKQLKRYLTAFVMVLFYGAVHSQQWTPTQELMWQERLELIASQSQSSNLDFSVLTDRLYDYLHTPLNLNTANQEELQNLGLLSSQQIESLLLQRIQFGSFLTVYELIYIPYFDSYTVQLIAPFFRCESTSTSLPNLKTLLRKSRHQILWRNGRVLQQLKGQKEQTFLGDANQYYLRYRLESMRQLTLGITLEKDVGEKTFLPNTPYLFDFQSWHVFYQPKKTLHTLALGDYQIRHGQGLNIWTGFSTGNAANPAMLSRYANTITAYSGANEFNFLRGAAITLSPTPSLKTTLFYSNRNVDANITTDTNLAFTEINIKETGWHRTAQELAQKKQLQLEVYGGVIEKEVKRTTVGLSWLSAAYHPIDGYTQSPYQFYQWNGKRFNNLGVNFSTQWHQWHLFGEIVQTLHGGHAMIWGSEWSLHPRLTASVQYRNYQVHYQAFLSQANGQNQNNSNENGLYMGVNFWISPRSQLIVYSDMYAFPWLKYRTDAPSKGEETWAQLNINFSKGQQGTLRYRRKSVSYNTPVTDRKSILSPIVVQQLRGHFLQQSTGPWITASRIEVSYTTSRHQLGWVGYQDFKYRTEKWSYGLRFLFFDVPDFYGRIYTYENDILNYFYIPSFNGRGSRVYLNLKWNVTPAFRVFGKIGHTIYADRTTVGSGLNTIEGRSRTDIRWQFQFKF